MVVCDNCIPYLVCANVIVLPVPSLLSPPVPAELRQADLMTSEECKSLYLKPYNFLSDGIRDVFTVQRGKSPVVMSKTTDVLKRHGFEEESKLLAGTVDSPDSHLFACLMYVVQ